jgi:hypothetical protein
VPAHLCDPPERIDPVPPEACHLQAGYEHLGTEDIHAELRTHEPLQTTEKFPSSMALASGVCPMRLLSHLRQTRGLSFLSLSPQPGHPVPLSAPRAWDYFLRFLDDFSQPRGSVTPFPRQFEQIVLVSVFPEAVQSHLGRLGPCEHAMQTGL